MLWDGCSPSAKYFWHAQPNLWGEYGEGFGQVLGQVLGFGLGKGGEGIREHEFSPTPCGREPPQRASDYSRSAGCQLA